MTQDTTPLRRDAHFPEGDLRRFDRRDWELAQIAQGIARLLRQADFLMAGRQEGIKLSGLEELRYRHLAEQTVIALDPSVLGRAESRVIDWIAAKLDESYGEDFNRDLCEDACRGAMDCLGIELERCWRERVRS